MNINKIKAILGILTLTIFTIVGGAGTVSAQDGSGIDINVGEETEDPEDNPSIVKTFPNNAEIREVIKTENGWTVTVYSPSNSSFTIAYKDSEWTPTTKTVQIAGDTETEVIVEDIGEPTAIWSGYPETDDDVYELSSPQKIFSDNANPLVTLLIGVVSFASFLAFFTLRKKNNEEEKIERVV